MSVLYIVHPSSLRPGSDLYFFSISLSLIIRFCSSYFRSVLLCFFVSFCIWFGSFQSTREALMWREAVAAHVYHAVNRSVYCTCILLCCIVLCCAVLYCTVLYCGCPCLPRRQQVHCATFLPTVTE